MEKEAFKAFPMIFDSIFDLILIFDFPGASSAISRHVEYMHFDIGLHSTVCFRLDDDSKFKILPLILQEPI